MGMNNVIAGKLLQFIEGMEWSEVEKQLALVREGIISKCKNAKLEEKRALGLEQLVGFDKCIQTIHNIANYREQESSEGEE